MRSRNRTGLVCESFGSNGMVRRIGDFGVESSGNNRWMINGTVRRVAAFTETPSGGNPAGVWMGETLPDPGSMQRIAAEIGFSETAFVSPEDGPERTVRYDSPEAEVSFCGHATIATGVVLGEIVFEANQYYRRPAEDSVPVIQLSDDDTEGRFPWDEGYAAPEIQPRPGTFRV